MKEFEKILQEENIKNIIFDFDGVILDSIPVKTEAFRKLFQDYPDDKVALLIDYHLQNGGISRYKKIEYFFTQILSRDITDEEINQYAERYSILTKEELSKPKYLIQETYDFIQKNYLKYNFHIASGADENDLKYICDSLGLTNFFKSIYGSPLEKNQIVKNIIENNKYNKKTTILIGDSINDFEAAQKNNINFYKYNYKSSR